MLDHPLFGLAVTVAVYAIATQVYAASGRAALLHPVLTSVVAVSSIVVLSGVGYSRYFEQASPLHLALGLLVVLLAVPLWRNFDLIRAAGLPIAVALHIGATTAIATALAVPISEAAPASLIASLAPKSATAAVAVGISDQLGGLPGLTAMVAVMTGLTGAVVGPTILSFVGVRDPRAIGFALGVASHAIGTARAFQISETAGTFAGLGMVLNALLTVVLAPVAVTLAIG